MTCGNRPPDSYSNSYLIHSVTLMPDQVAIGGTSAIQIEYNLLIVATNMGYDKFVYLKHGVASFSYNTMIGHGTYIQRHGSIQYCAANRTNSTETLQKCHGNWMEGTDGGRAGGFNIGGCGNDIRGNYIKAGTGIKLSNGFAQNNANEAAATAIDVTLPVLCATTRSGKPRMWL